MHKSANLDSKPKFKGQWEQRDYVTLVGFLVRNEAQYGYERLAIG